MGGGLCHWQMDIVTKIPLSPFITHFYLNYTSHFKCTLVIILLNYFADMLLYVIKSYLYLKYLIKLLDPKIKIKYVNMIMKLSLHRNVVSKRKLKPLNEAIRI